MAHKPETKTRLPTDWRADGYWKIIAMIYRVPQEQYNAEARRFATYHIQNETMSADWRRTWRDWCYHRLVTRFVPPPRKRVRPRLFE